MNEELESEKELEVAEPTEVDEKSPNNLEESIDDDKNLKFDDSDNNEKSDEEEKTEEPSSIKQQSKEENSKYAAARRKAEEEAQSKIDKAYERGKLDSYRGKINPYTNTEIKDLTDIEVYEDMYKIAQDGGEPLKDYASYAADKKREEIRIATEKSEREAKAQQEIEDFNKKYPDVNISSLFKDEVFMDYADGKNKSLIEVYESFNKLKEVLGTRG